MGAVKLERQGTGKSKEIKREVYKLNIKKQYLDIFLW